MPLAWRQKHRRFRHTSLNPKERNIAYFRAHAFIFYTGAMSLTTVLFILIFVPYVLAQAQEDFLNQPDHPYRHY